MGLRQIVEDMSEPEKFKILSNVVFTRNLILRSFCGIYLAAFLSFYIQAEGKLGIFIFNKKYFKMIII